MLQKQSRLLAACLLLAATAYAQSTDDLCTACCTAQDVLPLECASTTCNCAMVTSSSGGLFSTILGDLTGEPFSPRPGGSIGEPSSPQPSPQPDWGQDPSSVIITDASVAVSAADNGITGFVDTVSQFIGGLFSGNSNSSSIDLNNLLSPLLASNITDTSTVGDVLAFVQSLLSSLDGGNGTVTSIIPLLEGGLSAVNLPTNTSQPISDFIANAPDAASASGLYNLTGNSTINDLLTAGLQFLISDGTITPNTTNTTAAIANAVSLADLLLQQQSWGVYGNTTLDALVNVVLTAIQGADLSSLSPELQVLVTSVVDTVQSAGGNWQALVDLLTQGASACWGFVAGGQGLVGDGVSVALLEAALQQALAIATGSDAAAINDTIACVEAAWQQYGSNVTAVGTTLAPWDDSGSFNTSGTWAGPDNFNDSNAWGGMDSSNSSGPWGGMDSSNSSGPWGGMDSSNSSGPWGGMDSSNSSGPWDGMNSSNSSGPWDGMDSFNSSGPWVGSWGDLGTDATNNLTQAIDSCMALLNGTNVSISTLTQPSNFVNTDGLGPWLVNSSNSSPAPALSPSPPDPSQNSSLSLLSDGTATPASSSSGTGVISSSNLTGLPAAPQDSRADVPPAAVSMLVAAVTGAVALVIAAAT